MFSLSRVLPMLTHSLRLRMLLAAFLVVLAAGIGGYLTAKPSPSTASSGAGSSTSGHIQPSTHLSNGAQAPSAKPGSSSPKDSTPTPTSATSGSTPATGKGGTTAKSGSSSSSQSSSSSSSSTPPPAETYACTTSVMPHGQCGPYTNYAQIIGANSSPIVDQNVWGAGGTDFAQTLHANSPGDWAITASVSNNTSGAVLTYPNVGFNMPDGSNPGDHDGRIDSYSSITSSWNVTIPTDTSTTAGWAAYDLWFNNWADEVMIQVDITANSNYNCTAAASATIDGMAWHLCDFGSERVWKPGTDDSHLINRTSGTVDVKALLVWLEQNGHLPANSTWTAASFGFEVCNTSGATDTFKVNGFSWTAQ